jgi:hypothetical protein
MSWEAPPKPPQGLREWLAALLCAVGLAAVLWGVFHVVGSTRGDRPWAREFEERRSYDQVKVEVHRSLPGGAARAAAGLLLIVLGRRLWVRSDQRRE